MNDIHEQFDPEGSFGMELVLDLYECDPDTIRSEAELRRFVKELCDVIKMKTYGDMFAERFALNDIKTAGFSIVQLIETSSITGHFREEINSAYINIFSCKEFDVDIATEFTKKFFGAKSVESKLLIRK